METTRRGFFGLVAGVASVAAVPAIATREQPERSVGYRGVDWRGYWWWVDERGQLRWMKPFHDVDELHFIFLEEPITELVAGGDRLWILSVSGWYDLTFDAHPNDDTMTVRKRLHA